MKNLTGLYFGCLQVLGRLPSQRRGSDGRSVVLWECECECGVRLPVVAGNLTSGNTRSCACRGKDLTGRRFGHLVALHLIESTHAGARQYLCRCDCDPDGDNLVPVEARSLRRGRKTHCGCSHPEKTYLEDLTGRQFGRLTVRCYVGRHRGQREWLCDCACDKTSVVTTTNLLQGRVESCGCGNLIATWRWHREKSDYLAFKEQS